MTDEQLAGPLWATQAEQPGVVYVLDVAEADAARVRKNAEQYAYRKGLSVNIRSLGDVMLVRWAEKKVGE